MAINDDKKDYYHTDIDYLDLSDAVSAHECTGLIPEGESPADKDEKYKKIYAFGTPLKCADKCKTQEIHSSAYRKYQIRWKSRLLQKTGYIEEKI